MSAKEDNPINCHHVMSVGFFGKHEVARCKKCGQGFLDGIFSQTLTEMLN